MTALTWREMKRREHCDCGSQSRVLCARMRDIDADPCKCRCHSYEPRETRHEQPGTERAT